jgi:threonine/homoserine/homoserine lactone efflux protein
MTVSLWELGVYALAMAGLWVVPGPVWVALIARALSGGFASAWPLAVGVVLGDLIWPICAIFGLSWVLSVYGDFLSVLRWVASGVFTLMGVMLIRKPAAALSAESRLTKPGRWAGFLTGLAAVIGNPKAILFYMGVLPGFFDLGRVTAPDITAILFVSALVPLLGNLALALFVDRARALISSPENLHRINIGSGLLLILVGVVIVFT